MEARDGLPHHGVDGRLILRGVFITLEGGEGTGKSTQAKLLKDRFESVGRDVILTREPGGTPQGEAVRSLLVTGDVKRWSAEAEALLNYAARDCHLRDVIRPALARGAVVICDRFMDSTTAYQGYAGGADLNWLRRLRDKMVGATVPDQTFIFDLEPSVGLARAASRGKDVEDRYERKGLVFHEKLRAGFLAILAEEPKRCVRIDASQSIEAMSAAIWAKVNHGR